MGIQSDASGAPLTPQDIENLKAAHARGLSPMEAVLQGELMSISADDRHLCVLIGIRGFQYFRDAVKAGAAKDVPTDALTLSLDVAFAHLRRKLDLRAFLNADDFAFCQELGTIVRFIDRKLAIFPPLVTLRFAVSR